MKKALVVFLLLALVGGSLFAQAGLTWGGRAMAGLGMWKVGDDDAGWGIMTPSGATNGVRLNLTARYANEDNNKGFYTYFRARGASNSGRIFNHETFQVLYAEGWFTAFDGLLKVQGGRMTDSPFGYGDWWGMDDPSDTAYGLMATVNATDAIKIGFGTKSGNGLDKMELFEGINFFGGVRADLGLVDARAYLDYGKDNVTAHAAATIGLGDLEVILPLYVWDLTDYSDTGELMVLPTVTFSGIANLDIGLTGVYGMDSSKDDPFYGARAWVAYTLGNIIPRIDVGYVSGANYVGVDTALRADIWSGTTYDKGDAYLLIRPAVRFRTSSTSYVDLGAVVDNKMGDNKPSNAMSYGAFLDFSVSF